MEYKRPLSSDFEQIVTLQNRNLASVLTPTEKQMAIFPELFQLIN